MDNLVKKEVPSAETSPDSSRRLQQAPTAAKILGVHQTTLVRWAKQGRIPAYAVTGEGRTAWLFDVDEIAAALRANYSEVILVQRTMKERPKLTREKVSVIIQKFRSNSARK